MRTGAGRFDSGRERGGRADTSRRAAAPCALGAALAAVATLASVSLAAPGPSSARAAGAGAICSAPGSAKVPCRFSTPSGNIRCIWTPKPNNVACVLRSTGRAYRLRPSGKAKAIKLTLARPGKTLALTQQIVFPGSLSCRDTKRTMICNQDFATGAFTLAAKGSHSS
jgi:hypothetical protein